MWKTALGRCIFQTDSGCKVCQNFFYRWLTFGNGIIQSLVPRRRLRSPGLRYIVPIVHLVQSFPGDCCLLGLGGGGILHAISPLLLDSNITAVESSSEVIAIASRFFYLERIQNLTLIHQNAKDFVQSTKTSYQYLVVDLHDALDYPKECDTDAFFSQCKAILKPDGALVVNVLRIENKRPLLQRIRTQFNNATLLVPIRGTTNTLIVAFNTEKRPRFIEILEQQQGLGSLSFDLQWGLVRR